MPVTKEQARQKIAELVERFREHVDEYKRGGYNEHQTRIDYINPFFKALGWDMDNEQGLAEAYREVIHEDKVKVGGSTKAPDYGFTLYGQRKFFVDAKKPGIDIKGDIGPAYQVRRYGWSAKVPISIVTDFEEFSIYDCSKKPKTTDKASVSRIKYFTFEQYLDEFEFLWDTFGRENLPKGRFDKYVQSDTKQKGTTTVDDEFLNTIEEWRKYLATTIALRNKVLDEDEINFSVQKIIDRIIFLRMCEDRGVEPFGELKKAAEKGEIYQNLFQIFRVADDKYNSGLFDLKKDTITPSLVIDNKVLKNIIKDLYYPQCEYEFSVMPADILGSVYERFLGKTIRLTAGHSAKIEEKPEVRKAGGVYYTPKYIVDYIVENTVGKLLEGKTPRQVDKLKICDPACGSGSFLIGAYQYLLDWHLKYYTDKPGGGRGKEDPLTPDGNLTTAEKKRILTNNIYGVDIDAQAVEVTKLNLLLKALEGETQASINQQMQLFHERVLPNLNHNIQCGNSLIGPDFFDDKLELFPAIIKKVNAFDWNQGFQEVFFQGGFDAVIGNPPYGAMLSDDEDTYLRSGYVVASYQLDTYALFVEKATKIATHEGAIGFIIPSAWVSSVYDVEFREYLSTKTRIQKIITTPKKTFKDATVETLILLIANAPTVNMFVDVERWDNHGEKYSASLANISSDKFRFPVYSNPENIEIIDRIRSTRTRLSDFADVVWGVKVYEKGKGTPPQKGTENKSKIFHSSERSSYSYRPLIGGKEIFKYQLNWQGGYINYGKWLAAPRTPDWFEGRRIVVREVTSKGRIYATIIEDDTVFSNSVDGVRLRNATFSLEYLLAIINSKLISFYHTNTSPNAFKGTFPKVLVQDLRDFPVPVPSKESEEKINHLVKQILQLKNNLKSCRINQESTKIERAVSICVNTVEGLINTLYGLSEEEIDIIENAQ